MARNIRSAKLENRTSRLKLPVARKPIFERIGDGISLGYRRNQIAGTWVVRVADGKGGSWTKAIGMADDHEDANGNSILTFWQAQDQARLTARGGEEDAKREPITVGKAVENYLAQLESKNARTARDTRQRLTKHFLPTFAERLLASVTKTQLEIWLSSLVAKSPDPELVRRSKDTANRVLSMVKAAFNHALRDPSNGIKDDMPWRLVSPYKAVGRPRDVHFSIEQAHALIASTNEPCFRNLVIAGFITGARYGELAACKVRDFLSDAGAIKIRTGKTGGRTIILQQEAVEFFTRVIGQRGQDDPLLPRGDNKHWGRSHQARPMRAALSKAGLDEHGTFYALRHSYISRAIEGGTPLTFIAENCGTSVRMIETTYAKVLADKRRAYIENGAPRLGLVSG
jgi:integrase